MGATQASFLGLGGMGDLLATCSSPLSRNYRLGVGLAKGKSLEEVLTEIQSTVEGARSTKVVWEFAKARKIDMPITEAIYHAVYDKRDIKSLLVDLMMKPARADHF
jgi:glycerol-3-phosphate dehydrogenase (NAD(P)+)